MRPAVAATPEQQRAFQRAAAGAAAGAAGAPIAPLAGYAVADIWNGYEAPRYLVKRLLEPGALTILYGQSGHFKTALALDVGLSVGSGREFHGLRTSRAGVLYVAGEGHGGIKKRLRAWCLARGLDASAEQPALYMTTAGADLIGNPEQLLATVEHAAGILGVPIELVVIDTLAANFGAGDENHAGEMGLAIDGARQAAPGAAVLLLHHTGHGQVERERGSYALIAAADYRVQATYDEHSKLLELAWRKCKDDDRPEPLVFEWRTVPLEWQDADGEELTSIVLRRLEGASVLQGPKSAGMGKNQEAALKSLRTLYARARRNLETEGRDPAEAKILLDGWRKDCERRGLKRQRWHEVLEDLQERRLVALNGPHAVLIEGLP